MAVTRKKPVTIEERVHQLEFNEETTARHLKDAKELGAKTYDDVRDIKSAIIGNAMNGDYGLVHSVKDIKDKQDLHDDLLNDHKLYFKQMGVVISAVIALVVGLIIKISVK